jgi:hypothetical protein
MSVFLHGRPGRQAQGPNVEICASGKAVFVGDMGVKARIADFCGKPPRTIEL